VGVLRTEDGDPTDAAWRSPTAFATCWWMSSDTSRRQHQLLASLIAAWPDRAGAPASPSATPCSPLLLPRRRRRIVCPREGDRPGDSDRRATPLDFLALTANFRTAPGLVNRLNQIFEKCLLRKMGAGSVLRQQNLPATPNPRGLIASSFTLSFARNLLQVSQIVRVRNRSKKIRKRFRSSRFGSD